MRGLGDPFNGKPEYFLQWRTMISRRMEECQADALDCIQILVENSIGEVKESVKVFLSAGLTDPEITLRDVWEMLEERYGNEDRIAESVERRLHDLARVKDPGDLLSMQRLVDTCKVASSAMLANGQLLFLNSIRGIDIILDKLPRAFYNRWLSRHKKHKGQTGHNPDFHLLVEFLSSILEEMNLPYLKRSKTSLPASSNSKNAFKSFQTNAQPVSEHLCPYHQSNSHKIAECIMFGSLPFQDRKRFVSDSKLCFKCLEPHRVSNCPNALSIQCKYCRSDHVTSMHKTPPNPSVRGSNRGGNSSVSRASNPPVSGRMAASRGGTHTPGRPSSSALPPPASRGRGYSPNSSSQGTSRALSASVSIGRGSAEQLGNNSNVGSLDQASSSNEQREFRSACTTFKDSTGNPRICSKTLLVDIMHDNNPVPLRGLCILDDQSNASFCNHKVVDCFGPPALTENYSLTTLNGTIQVTGKSIAGLRVRGINQGKFYHLPPLLTHPDLPDTRSEAATSHDVLAIPHISHLHHLFPSSTAEFDVLLLLGANCGELMHVLTIGSGPPFIHQTPLGHAVVGPVCLEATSSSRFNCLRTSTAPIPQHQPIIMHRSFTPDYSSNILGDPFEMRQDDELSAMSQDDLKFMEIITNGITVNQQGNLEMPLPLKAGVPIPDNKSSVYCRTKNTLLKLKSSPSKLESSLKVFGEYLSAGHVEPITDPYNQPERVCYLPIFPIYNENKGKTRLVWDPSATVGGECLNDALLQGPDEVCNLWKPPWVWWFPPNQVRMVLSVESR